MLLNFFLTSLVAIVLGLWLGGGDPLITAIFYGVSIFINCLYLRGSRSAESIQGIALSLGIFGTFAGIIFALSGLDLTNSDIKGSIESLLSGIYPAFLSSLFGVGVTIWIQTDPKYWQKEEGSSVENDTESLIFLEIQKLNKNIMGEGNKSSLANKLDQIVLHQKQMSISFETFAEKMAENNMNALKDVIKEFNTKLQEQFGENFKRLNEAVFELVNWQSQYKEIVENSQKMFNQVFQDLNKYSQSIENQEKIFQNIVKSMSSFNQISVNLENNLNKLKDGIDSIDNFSNSLDGKAEKIQGNMKKIVENAITELGSNLKSLSKALVDDYTHVRDAIAEIKNNK